MVIFFHSGLNYCLQEVIDIIERNLDEAQQQKLLKGLGINSEEENLMFSQKLENIPWDKIKLQLELLGRNDVVDMITQNALITKSNYLRFLFIKTFLIRNRPRSNDIFLTFF